jgi:hypothetical protein
VLAQEWGGRTARKDEEWWPPYNKGSSRRGCGVVGGGSRGDYMEIKKKDSCKSSLKSLVVGI